MPCDRKERNSHPGRTGRIRRRIRSLYVKASMYKKMGRPDLVADKKRQIRALRLYLELFEMEEKREKILKELEALGPVPEIEPYISAENGKGDEEA